MTKSPKPAKPGKKKKPVKTITATPISDVAGPGKSPPDDTSRAIIINRQLLQDPMMVAAATSSEPGDDNDEATRPAVKMAATAKPKLQPPPALPVPSAEPETVVPEATEASQTVPVKAQAVAEPETDYNPPVVEAKTESSAVKTQAVKTEDAARLERETKIEQIIASKKYFLPIQTVEQRRSARFVALGIVLALVLGLGWLDIALDAGLIHLTGLKALTHLFTS